MDDVILRPVIEQLPQRQGSAGARSGSGSGYLDNFIAFWLGMGYDFVRFELSLPFPERQRLIADAAPGSTKDRAWPDEHQGMTTTGSNSSVIRGQWLRILIYPLRVSERSSPRRDGID